MTSWLETYKPVASSRVQLWLAGAMWSAVGVGLASVGGYWLLRYADDRILLLLVLALCVGFGKSLLVLDRAVHRFVNRIQIRGDGKCAGGFLSLRGWALVGGMILLGRLLRGSGISRPLLGLVYAGVGTSLLISSRLFWRAWLNHQKLEGGRGGS
jgi:hypothetical protein